MRVTAELFQRAVTEQDRAGFVDERLPVRDEQLAPLMAFVQLFQVVSLAQDDGAGFVEQREHVSAARAGFAVGGYAERDMCFADSAFGSWEGQPDQRVHDVVQVVGADDEFVVFDHTALEVNGAQVPGRWGDEAGNGSLSRSAGEGWGEGRGLGRYARERIAHTVSISIGISHSDGFCLLNRPHPNPLPRCGRGAKRGVQMPLQRSELRFVRCKRRMRAQRVRYQMGQRREPPMPPRMIIAMMSTAITASVIFTQLFGYSPSILPVTALMST